MGQTLHKVATKESEEIKRTTKQKMARRHNKEEGNHLEQESNRQKTIEDIAGGLHPAVDGQSLGERWKGEMKKEHPLAWTHHLYWSSILPPNGRFQRGQILQYAALLPASV